MRKKRTGWENAYNGGSTIIYMSNAWKVLLRKIHELALDLLNKEFTLNFVAKVFNEYTEQELHIIEKELSCVSQLKREYWIKLIKKSFSNKSILSKKKILNEKIKIEDKVQNIFKKENINKKIQSKNKKIHLLISLFLI